MENELVTVFLSHKLGRLIEDISSKKITTQEHLDLVWDKVFDEAVKIEKKQMDIVAGDWWNEGASYMCDGKRKYESFEQYYNETFLK